MSGGGRGRERQRVGERWREGKAVEKKEGFGEGCEEGAGGGGERGRWRRRADRVQVKGRLIEKLPLPVGGICDMKAETDRQTDAHTDRERERDK